LGVADVRATGEKLDLETVKKADVHLIPSLLKSIYR
jgi:hypothetical protein